MGRQALGPQGVKLAKEMGVHLDALIPSRQEIEADTIVREYLKRKKKRSLKSKKGS